MYRPESPTTQSTVRSVISLLLLFSAFVPVAAIELKLGQEFYQIELATTPGQRQQGLMHRQRLAPGEGMLLVYEQAGNHRIWMKNMLIPLRVYWIDADFTVLDMQRLEPCTGSPCPIFSVAQDSKYVLELGDYDHPLAPGDRIEAIRVD
ncbi:MAG TPA: DUF192 domain-containing protein [Gammaproteobacteria bacterium]|nr:DUF192 domain-containing protein [Gammaproteobacteria bacterium]